VAFSKKDGPKYEFGAFRLDPSERLLSREGRTVQLAPKVFDTLIALIENSGRLIGDYLASVFAALGKKQEALALLERACGERSCWLSRLGVDPIFDSLWRTPGFETLLINVGGNS
jgi:hypothetical protein